MFHEEMPIIVNLTWQFTFCHLVEVEAGQSCGGPGGPGGGTASLKICHQGIPDIRYTMIGTEKNAQEN